MALNVPTNEKIQKVQLMGRRKIELKPGKGLMDWIRLSNRSRLSSYPMLPFVNEEELSRHDKLNDCWILLFDMVYDITQYLEFHPGGLEELMRAAGRDATELFNTTHTWVNYRSMLKSCVVGPFHGDRQKLRRPLEILDESEV